MDLVTALSLSIGILGGIATWLFFQFGQGLGLGLQIWAAFLGWASFYHCGGGGKGFSSSVLANIWGVVMAWLTLLAVTRTGLADSMGLPVWAGICVAIGVAILVLGAKIPAFSSIPAGVYGYAATVALSLLGKDGLGNLTQPSLANPAIIVALSLIIGNIFGYVSQQLAGSMAKA
jgi:hypothetical protein